MIAENAAADHDHGTFCGLQGLCAITAILWGLRLSCGGCGGCAEPVSEPCGAVTADCAHLYGREFGGIDAASGRLYRCCPTPYHRRPSPWGDGELREALHRHRRFGRAVI